MALSTAQCFSLVRGRRMRVTQLDGCGQPVNGPAVSVASKGFVSVAFSAQTAAGTEISVSNASGEVCVRDAPVPTFTGYTVTLTFCEVNPELLTIVTGQRPVFDLSSGEANGFTVDSSIGLQDSAFALEIWSNVPGVQCVGDGSSGKYGYTLVPFLQGGVFGDFTIQNDAVTFTVSGAATKTGSGWGVGPYNVMLDATDTPAPLQRAVKAAEHLWVQLTEVAPPDAACGAQSRGAASTTGTQVSGTVGTYSPSNSYAPPNLATAKGLAPGIPALTASPTTAWATGSYIVLGDGTHAKWNGTTWITA